MYLLANAGKVCNPDLTYVYSSSRYTTLSALRPTAHISTGVEVSSEPGAHVDCLQVGGILTCPPLPLPAQFALTGGTFTAPPRPAAQGGIFTAPPRPAPLPFPEGTFTAPLPAPATGGTFTFPPGTPNPGGGGGGMLTFPGTCGGTLTPPGGQGPGGGT